MPQLHFALKPFALLCRLVPLLILTGAPAAQAGENRDEHAEYSTPLPLGGSSTNFPRTNAAAIRATVMW